MSWMPRCTVLVSARLEVFQCPLGIQAQVELVFPTELEPCSAQGVVAQRRAGVTFGQVGRMGGYLVGHDARADVLLVRESQMLLRRDVAEHGRPEPAYYACAYRARYVDPLVAVAVSVLVLGEGIGPLQLLGGALILGFTLWNELSSAKKKEI